MAGDELWDLTDAEGIPVGRTHRRADPAFPAGLFHVVASVCVVRADGRVLITQRAAGKDHPLAWEFPAGSALAGETSRQAAACELAEEAGVPADAADLELAARIAEQHALFDLYVARAAEDPPLALDPDEVVDAAWVRLDEVWRRCDDGRMAQPWIRRLAVHGDALAEAVERPSRP